MERVLGAEPLPPVTAVSKRWSWRQRGVGAWSLKSDKQMESLYNLIFALPWAASGALTGIYYQYVFHKMMGRVLERYRTLDTYFTSLL